MSTKNLLLFSFSVLFMISCNPAIQFPPKKFQKVELEQVSLTQSIYADVIQIEKDSVNFQQENSALNNLLLLKRYYDSKDENFNIKTAENEWQKLKVQNLSFGFEDVGKWIEITGFLLEITGESIYASELEATLFKSSEMYSGNELKRIEEWITPWIFTKNVDHICVNLFVNSTIKYNHTLKGMVEITQNTDYPQAGQIQIEFKMEEKRYIELFIRIPEWAKNVTIIEKGVKYVATPGEYSQIVRKWKNGDVVNIDFSMKDKPEWLN